MAARAARGRCRAFASAPARASAVDPSVLAARRDALAHALRSLRALPSASEESMGLRCFAAPRTPFAGRIKLTPADFEVRMESGGRRVHTLGTETDMHMVDVID